MGIDERPTSTWRRGTTLPLPEYDLEIIVFGDRSERPYSERFKLRAGRTCALEMLKANAAGTRADTNLSEHDPRIYLVDITDEGDTFFPETPFVIENRGGEVAHKIQIQTITLGDKKIVFPPRDNLSKGEKATILPTIEDADMDKHCILPVLTQAWNATGMKDGAKDFLEFAFSVNIKYESFTGTRRIETCIDLTYSYIQQKWQSEHGGKWPHRQYKIFDIKKTTFRLL